MANDNKISHLVKYLNCVWIAAIRDRLVGRGRGLREWKGNRHRYVTYAVMTLDSSGRRRREGEKKLPNLRTFNRLGEN